MKNVESILFETNAQRVLSLLLGHPSREFIEQEVCRLTGVSKSGANYALRGLAAAGLIIRQRKGKMYIYSLCRKKAVVRQLKVLKNVMRLEPFITKAKGFCLRIVLFGSCALGDNISESDIDLFIVSNHPNVLFEKLLGRGLSNKAQLILRTPAGEIELKRKDPVFYGQIQGGIVLWESE